jgi:hypothetical protein
LQGSYKCEGVVVTKELKLWKCCNYKGVNYKGVGVIEMSVTKMLQLWRC